MKDNSKAKSSSEDEDNKNKIDESYSESNIKNNKTPKNNDKIIKKSKKKGIFK